MDERRSELHPLELEKWLLGEQSARERAHSEAQLPPEEQAALRAQDQALRAALMEAQSPASFAARVRKLAASKPSRQPVHRLALLGAAMTAALALLVVVRNELPDDSAAVVQSERTKGVGFELRVYRQRGDRAERLPSGAETAPHELLQLGYLRDGNTYGVLLSIDGRGGVTMHFPQAEEDSTALPTGSGEQLLREAYELDDAPGFERFVFVGATEPLSAREVLRAARTLADDVSRRETSPLPLDVPNEQRTVLLHKSPAR